jgi:histidyl-tRNA synthetase
LGRYREFLQADIDLIDSRPLTIQSDIEIIQVIRDILAALPIPAVTLLVNNRKLLDGFYRALGIEQIAEVLRIMDKLDKIGEEKVRFYLIEELGIPCDAAERCIRLGQIRGNTAMEIRKRVEECGLQHPRLQEGLDELCTVLDIFGEQAGCRVTADLSIARGFDYYTGTVCEGKFDQFPRYPTVVAGGRYDHLATDNAAKLPGVGMSLGVTRILGLVLHEGLIRASRKTPVCVMVALVSEETRPRSLKIAQILRERGIPCEVYTRPDAYGKQIAYADGKGIPYVWFPSETGLGSGELRDLRKRTQIPADPHHWTPAREDLAVTIQWDDAARQALLVNPKYCKK